MDDDIEMTGLTNKENPPKKEVSTMKPHKNWKYTFKEKLSFVELAREKGKHYVSETFNIDRKSLREWEKNEAKLKQQTDLKKFRIEGGGRKSDISLENEDNIASWIIKNRKLGFAIKSQNVIMYTKKLILEFNDKSNDLFFVDVKDS